VSKWLATHKTLCQVCGNAQFLLHIAEINRFFQFHKHDGQKECRIHFPSCVALARAYAPALPAV